MNKQKELNQKQKENAVSRNIIGLITFILIVTIILIRLSFVYNQKKSLSTELTATELLLNNLDSVLVYEHTRSKNEYKRITTLKDELKCNYEQWMERHTALRERLKNLIVDYKMLKRRHDRKEMEERSLRDQNKTIIAYFQEITEAHDLLMSDFDVLK